MDLIILIIIIFLIVRAVKKKKKNKAESSADSGAQTSTAAESTADASAESADEAAVPGVDVSAKDEAQVYITSILLRTEEMRSTPPAKADIPDYFEDRTETAIFGAPDLAFACAKSVVEECQRKEGSLVLSNDEKNMAYQYMQIGLKLAEYYRDGYGCDRDPEAGIQLLDRIIAFWQDQKNAGYGGALSLFFNAHLVMADCYAALGDMRKANQFYRMSFAMAKVFENGKENVRIRVLEHVLGEYDFDRPQIPRPMSMEVATELSLSMMALGHSIGGHEMLVCTEFRDVDTGKIGKSWEQDLEVYKEAGGIFSLYRLGRYMLYGLGVPQDVKKGLDLLVEAYLAGSYWAARQIQEYYYKLENYETFSDKAQKRQVKELSAKWSRRADDLKRNTSAMDKIMSVSGVAQTAEEYVVKFKYR